MVYILKGKGISKIWNWKEKKQK